MATEETTPSIVIRAPTTYAYSSTTPGPKPPASYTSPPLDFLTGTWCVTHSTLPMWRSAQNVRIAYKPMQTSDSNSKGPMSLIDEVSSTPTKRTWLPQPKIIRGVSSSVNGRTDIFDWKGQGWLRIAGTTRWEVLGWGERTVSVDGSEEREKWVVTWFKASKFTPMGVDFYTSRREGMTEETSNLLREAVEAINVEELKKQVKEGLFQVKIEL